MKMKKLLSIGALGLVMACSTSVASFAADTASLSNDEKAIIVAMAKEYKDGGSFLGVDKNTVISDKLSNTQGIRDKLATYKSGQKLLKYLDFNGTVNENAHSVVEKIINKCEAAGDANAAEAEFNTIKGQIEDVAKDVLDFDNAAGTERADKEAKLKELLANSDYNVVLGKNGDGVTTISVESKTNGAIALQVSKDNVTNVIKVLETLTLQDLKDINAGQNNIIQ